MDRVDNGVFFGTPYERRGESAIPEVVFYGGRPRPAPEVSVAERAAASTLRFGVVLFLVGWAGILFQAQIFQQVVIGAPLFEELAKLGPPLIIVALLGIRSVWVRLPLAWAFGAAFGVFEHYVTYSSEDALSYATRVVFHAISPGLSMLVYGAFEPLADPTARWGATLPATLFHWANNFAAILFGVASLAIPGPVEAIASVWGGLLIVAMAFLTVYALVARTAFEERCRLALAQIMPRIAVMGSG